MIFRFFTGPDFLEKELVGARPGRPRTIRNLGVVKIGPNGSRIKIDWGLIFQSSKFVSKTDRFGSRIPVSNWTLRNRYSIYAKSLSKFLVSPINFFKGVIRFSASFESVKVQVFYFFQKFYSSDVGSLVAWFNIQKLKKVPTFTNL